MTTYDGYDSSKTFKTTYKILFRDKEIGQIRALSESEAQKKADEKYPNCYVEVTT